jgi:Domain of unknown function (DUF4868)
LTINKPFTAAAATLGEGLSMLVVERPSRKAFSIAEIKTSDDAQAGLVSAWEETLARIADDSALVDYTPDLLFRAGDPRIPVLNKSIADENEIVADLLSDADRSQEAPRRVSSAHLYLYALVSDTEQAGRVVMIKKQTPAKKASEGKWWGLPSNELQRMDADPWQIHPFFDLVVSADGTYVLRLSALDQLLGDSQVLVEHVDGWVSAITSSLPIAEGQADILIERCKSSSRLRNRLRAINSRGHLSRVTIDKVEEHAKRMQLEPSEFIDNNQLVVSEANADQLLKLLNEDLFTGGLTGDPFVTDGKEPWA